MGHALYIRYLFLILLKTAGLSSAQTTDVVNPAFMNIAPCGCDLTVDQLDNNCCCDENYNATAYSDKFNCIPGPFGGNFSSQNDQMCSAVLSFTPDWFPLLCVQYLNSPSLGLYFYPSATTGSADPISYNRNVSSLTVANFLQAGDTIDAQYQNSQVDVLRFPQVSASGNCARQSPVRYLYSTTASCDVTVDSSICGSSTVLDAQYYTSMSSIHNQTGTVSYRCVGSNDAVYVRRNTGSGGTASSTAPSPCSYATPSVGSGVCQNAVAAVAYTVTWSAGNISQFDILITLMDVEFTTSDSIATSGGPDFILVQQFSVDFVTDSANPVAYSGFPGYEIGLPVITSEGSSASTVDRSIELLVWKPGFSGSCDNTEAPKFGLDEVSGCLVDTTSNCTALRLQVEALQLQLLQANRVARFGNPSDNNTDEDWVDVISSFPNQTYNDTTGYCEGIPSRAVIKFLWTKSGETNGTDIREIVSAYVSLETEAWTLRCTGGVNCDARSIYSTVTFIEIPPAVPVPETSYALNRNDTCKKDATCWPELLLPLQPEFYYLYSTTVAFELRSYNYAWAIFVTFFSIAAALLPAHWSSVGKYLKQVLPI